MKTTTQVSEERVTVTKERDETGVYWNVYLSCWFNGRYHNAQIDLQDKPDRHKRKELLSRWVASVERLAGA